MELNFYFDDNNVPRVRCDEEGCLLGQYLESDIQDSEAIGMEILEKVRAVSENRLESWEITGNAHTLSLNCFEAQIQSLFNESQEPLQLPLFQLKLILTNWLTFLSKKK